MHVALLNRTGLKRLTVTDMVQSFKELNPELSQQIHQHAYLCKASIKSLHCEHKNKAVLSQLHETDS